MGNARIPNIEPSIQAGIPLKGKSNQKALDDLIKDRPLSWRKENIKKQLRIIDEQDAVNRYQWYNLPCNLSSQELERLIYYRGQLCFFYIPELKQFIFSPYALDGTIDYYGRYNTVHPVPFAEGTDNENNVPVAKYLSNKKLDVLYGIPTSDEDVLLWVKKFSSGQACVLVHDYSKQNSQTILARQIINDPLLDIMSDCIPFMRTALLSNTGIKGMRIPNQADYPNVLEANKSIEKAGLTGEMYVPMVGSCDFQELTGNQSMKAEEYLLAMQGLDNYRLSLYGLDNGGLFQKKSHMLEAEQTMNAGKSSIPLNDGLSIRQYFCDVVNSVTGIGMSCEIAEEIISSDMNMDGLSIQEADQTGKAVGTQPEGSEENGQ